MNALTEKQILFSSMIAELLKIAEELEYGVVLGHAYRCDDCKVGKKNSLHKICLAIDLNLFRDDEFLTETKDYTELGEIWEDMGGTWGGRFNDGNHFSLKHNGVM